MNKCLGYTHILVCDEVMFCYVWPYTKSIVKVIVFLNEVSFKIALVDWELIEV